MNKNLFLYAASNTLIIVLLLVFAWLAIASLKGKSATFDEANHLVRGLYPLTGNGFLLNREHPPLVNLLQALPVHFAIHPKIPPATLKMYPFFFHSEKVLWSEGNDGKKMIYYARQVTVGMAVILGFLIYIWAKKLHGKEGGIAALCLFTFSPMMLAHGRLVTTDLGLALFLFAFFFALWSLIIHPSFVRLLMAGLCLGAALGSKHVALLALPASLFILIFAETIGRADLAGTFNWTLPPFFNRLLIPVLVWLGLIMIAFLVVWGLYGFQVGKIDGQGIPIPAPDYFNGLFQGWQSIQSGRAYYLNGIISDVGWVPFFPLAFLYKTPLPILLLLIIVIFFHLRGNFHIGKKMNFIAFGIYFLALVIILKKINLGLRYLLWLYPFLFLYISTLTRLPKWRLAFIPLLAWLVFETLSAHPHYLSFFNRAMPQQEKRLYLVDSNLDWGQDLPALASFQRENGVYSIQLGYFGTADPKAYGVLAKPLPSFMRSDWNGPPTFDSQGIIAVSATLLQGLYNRPKDFYAPLRGILPTTQIGGGSILIFDCRKETQGCESLSK